MAKIASKKALWADCLDMYEEIRVTTNDLLDALDRLNLPPSNGPWPNMDDMRNRLRNLNSLFENYMSAIQKADD